MFARHLRSWHRILLWATQALQLVSFREYGFVLRFRCNYVYHLKIVSCLARSVVAIYVFFLQVTSLPHLASRHPHCLWLEYPDPHSRFCKWLSGQLFWGITYLTPVFVLHSHISVCVHFKSHHDQVLHVCLHHGILLINIFCWSFPSKTNGKDKKKFQTSGTNVGGTFNMRGHSIRERIHI